MPRPPHLCTCGKTIPNGIRCACQITSTRARNARHDATRPSARERGYDHKWQQARTTYLVSHRFCAFCNALSTVVDHRTPHRGNQALFWDQGNWQALCIPCHNRVKQRLDRA